MVLFLADALQSIVTTLMKIFLKSEVLNAAKCVENKLFNLDVFNLANQIPSRIIRLPTAAKRFLKSTSSEVISLKHLLVCCASA